MLIAVAYTSVPARMEGLVYAGIRFSFVQSFVIVLIASPVMLGPHLILPYVAGLI